MAVIEIPDEQAESLRAKAQAQGLTLNNWLERLADSGEGEELSLSKEPLFQNVAEMMEEIMRDVPPEIWDSMPHDGASQHDHYLYGCPKREE